MITNGEQRKLNEYIVETQERYLRDGFKWGVFDCVHWVADWALLVTGIDPLGDYRGAYDSRENAFALLASRDGSLPQALGNRFREVHPSKAMRGAIAYLASIESCGIYFTSGSRMAALFLSEGGFALHRARDTDRAFLLR